MFVLITTKLVFSNEGLNDIMKINKSLKESGLFKKSRSKRIKNEAREERGEFLGMLLGTLGAILLGNVLAGESPKTKMSGTGVIRARECTIRSTEGMIRAVQDVQCRIIL